MSLHEHVARELGEIGVGALIGELHGGLDHGAHLGVERVQRGVIEGTLFLQLHHQLGDRVALLLLLHRSEEHTSELQSQSNLVCRLLLEKKKKEKKQQLHTQL